MKYYIEAYYKDGTQCLGSIDGQAVLHGDYKRNLHYKRLKTLPASKLSLNSRIKQYRIVLANGSLIETINKD